MKCMRLNCQETACKYPQFSFASQVAPNGSRVEFTLPIAVCDIHAVPRTEDFMDDRGWQQICMNMVIAGYAMPDRDTLKLTFVPIT